MRRRLRDEPTDACNGLYELTAGRTTGNDLVQLVGYSA
jgi:hypothetical protein